MSEAQGARRPAGVTRVLFRCDGSPTIGLGHLVRCMVLATKLTEHQGIVRFVCREDPAGMTRPLMAGKGFSFLPVDGVDRAAPELSEQDCAQVIDTAREWPAAAVIVDHYGATSAYLNALRATGAVLGVIDDRADRDLAAVDWLLNQNLGAHRHRYAIRPDCVALLGPRFALLRPEFAAARDRMTRSFSRDDGRVLVTLGGGDTTDQMIRVLDELARVRRPLQIRCIVARVGAGAAKLAEFERQTKHRVEVLPHVDDMTPHMLWADLAISAGGSTCWELSCLGLPMIVVPASEEQRLVAAALQEAGVAMIADLISEGGPLDLATQTEGLLSDSRTRAQMSTTVGQLVDGQGADRVARSLIMTCAGHDR
jgi:UDP-2,4-diacetamido-2,4,6-trideoxy-beta-L-altropyranose hydrolase